MSHTNTSELIDGQVGFKFYLVDHNINNKIPV